jgi:hypothetical protein
LSIYYYYLICLSIQREQLWRLRQKEFGGAVDEEGRENGSKYHCHVVYDTEGESQV